MFDYDGVIADSLDAHVSCFLAAFRENGCSKVNSAKDILDLYEDNVYQSMAALGLSCDEIDRILASYKINQSLLLNQIQLFPGIREMFSALSSAGHRVYIITSNVAEAVSGVLAERGVFEVDEVYGLETAKCKVEKIRMAMERHPDLPAFYVGDTKGDIFEGRQAGAATVGVSWGWHGPLRLKESRPDHIIYEPLELPRLLIS